MRERGRETFSLKQQNPHYLLQPIHGDNGYRHFMVTKKRVASLIKIQKALGKYLFNE